MPHLSIDDLRLRQLAELAILDTPLDPLVERVCAIAASIFDVPMAYVSLIDATHQHLMARHGVDLGCVERKDAICNLTICDDAPLIVEDTLKDPRTRDNALVLGDPRIRFYAGIPLSLSPGVRLGAFCIAGTKPRTIDDAELTLLNDLADLVVGQIRFHADRVELAQRTLEANDRKTILAQAEHLAQLGGFEANPVTGAMIWSEGLDNIFGVARDIPKTIDYLTAFFSSKTASRLLKGFAQVADGAPAIDLEAEFTTPPRMTRHVRIRALGCGENLSRRIIGIIQDVTERKAAIADLEWIATHDDLTQLLNRAAMVTQTDNAIRDASESGNVALVTLDIDGFRTLNDTYGHAVGDALLVATAKRLTDVVGSRGVISRIGGDEFAVLVEKSEEGAAASIATDILLALREPITVNAIKLDARATLGVALQSAAIASATDLLKEADIALTHAREGGRDSFMFYRPAMREALEARAARLAVARSAIFAGRIEPWYQPKINLETNEIVGFEALMRWQHPTLGTCGPDAMGDVFSDAEIAIAIGRSMLYRISADMMEWRRHALEFGHVAINVAEPEFYAGDYADRVFACLANHHLEPNRLEVEVTESVFLAQRSDNVAGALQKLAEGGIAIALDDFGTGYASLTHLKRYPVSSIKIDRSFVSEIECDADAATIVDAVTSLANSLKIGVVAEGIETPAQLAFLKQRRCAAGQGYFFAKAMPARTCPASFALGSPGR